MAVIVEAWEAIGGATIIEPPAVVIVGAGRGATHAEAASVAASTMA